MKSNIKTKKTTSFLGAMIPLNKRLIIGLTYVYGIGLSTSKRICESLNFNEDIKIKSISPSQFKEIKQFITRNELLVGADKKRLESNHIKRLIVIKCYRGIKLNKSFRSKK